MPRTSEPGRSVSSRLLQVLFAFQPEESDLSLAELERKTGLPHATVRRLVMELTNAGALNRRSDGRLTIGPRLWQLGTPAPLTESLRTTAQPFMEDLYTEELTPGADSVAARIVDGEGRAVAALSVIVRSGSVKQQAALPSVIASGLGISRLLGWRPGIKIRQG